MGSFHRIEVITTLLGDLILDQLMRSSASFTYNPLRLAKSYVSKPREVTKQHVFRDRHHFPLDPYCLLDNIHSSFPNQPALQTFHFAWYIHNHVIYGYADWVNAS